MIDVFRHIPIGTSLTFGQYTGRSLGYNRIPLPQLIQCRSRIMSQNWKQWEGQVVSGKFPLLRYLGGSEYSAVFLTEFNQSERPQRAAIKLIPAGGETDELQLSRWRAAVALSHPHLISTFDEGRCEVAGVALLYVVME